ncbi:MAG TPA: CBS domain-containing protein [Burkholderiales bacterium]
MKASDIMTSPVITVNPQTKVRHIAALLLRHAISALPVLERGELVGIVSEADLLHRHELGTEARPRGAWRWLRLLSVADSSAEYVKSHATRARDIMTAHVVCVAPETPLAEIASLLEKRGVRRVPVLERGRLVGIVSRSDLVQALAAQARVVDAGSASDREIRERLLKELSAQPWWVSTAASVLVTDRVVHYFGTVDSEQQRRAARVAAENVPGVRGVSDHRISIAALAWSV